jgi:rSAM/selenodomain-associated transferase 1
VTRLIVFVKAPRPGFVKTRLAQTLGAVQAADIYISIVDSLLARFDQLEQVELRYSPDDAREEIGRWLRPRWQARPQGHGDLGQRLEHAFGEAFACGARRVVVIGSDCPAVEPEDIEAAWAALETCDVVLGPAQDGGYWLIGLAAPHPEVFRAVPWSTDQVLAETLARCRIAGLTVHHLRTLSDIDTAADWAAFERQRGTAR